MQSRETSQAGAQAPGAEPEAAQPYTATDKPLTEQALDQLTELAALSWSVSELYSDQIKLAGQTAKAEWRLTGRSLIIAAALVVCFGAGLILLWGSILLLLGYALFALTSSLAISAVALILLQCALLWWCWRSLSYVLTQVGFDETVAQLRRLFTVKAPGAAQGGTDAD